MFSDPVATQRRFDAMVVKDPVSGCWLWQGCTPGFGYGKMRVDRKHLSAHRISWMLHRGGVPAGHSVLHKCDVPACANPDHLFLGTQADNIADKVAKGRQATGKRTSYYVSPETFPRGERAGTSKFSNADARHIRRLFKTGLYQKVLLADVFGVSDTAISNLINGKTWRTI